MLVCRGAADGGVSPTFLTCIARVLPQTLRRVHAVSAIPPPHTHISRPSHAPRPSPPAFLTSTARSFRGPRLSARAWPRQVLILGPRGVERSFQLGFALQNLLGGLDRQRAAEQALGPSAI